MNLRRVFGLFLRQLYIIRNTPSRVVPYFLFALLDIVLWGFVSIYFGRFGTGFSVVAALLGGVIFWSFVTRVQQGITIPFLEDIWTRNLLNTFASPLRLQEYVMSFVLASMATSLFGLLVMIGISYLAFGYSLFSLGLALLPFLLVLFLFGIVIGIFASSIVMRFGPYAEWFIWPIPGILSPLVGVFYPVSTLPPYLQIVSYILPPSYVFEGMRSIVQTGSTSFTPLLYGTVLTLVYLGIAYAIFAVTYRIVVKRGMIARFSAEGG